jgi:hypothetical protein
MLHMGNTYELVDSVPAPVVPEPEPVPVPAPVVPEPEPVPVPAPVVPEPEVEPEVADDEEDVPVARSAALIEEALNATLSSQ